MKIVKAGHEHISQLGVTPYQFIERIGRICYKSEDKITEDSAVKFVKGLVSRGHTAMIEHFWVHLSYSGDYRILYDKIEDFVTNDLNDLGDYSTLFRFMQVTNDVKSKTVLLSCPIRVFTELSNRKLVQDNIPLLIREMFHAVQKEYFDFFNETATFFREDRVLTNQFVVWNESDFIFMMKEAGLPEQEIMKHNTHTFNFICNRGVSHELVRHRPCSFAQESTRYCNYSKDKFGKEITVIEPLWLSGKNVLEWEDWERAIRTSEMQYFKLLDKGWSPQEARGVLPNDLKTEVVVTANETEWQHIVNLRSKQTTGKAHPQMVEVMTPVYEELKVLSEGRIK